MGNEIRLF